MKKRGTLHNRRPVLATAGRSPRVGTRGRRCRSTWPRRGLVALVLSGLLLSVGTFLGKAAPLRDAPPLVPEGVQPPAVVVVQEDPLPPVLQRIAQCESRGQHLTSQGKVTHGTRNPHDTGLFQINRVVWGKKSAELGYDIRTLEGNVQMARYIFENYGSAPWRSSAKCWRRVS